MRSAGPTVRISTTRASEPLLTSYQASGVSTLLSPDLSVSSHSRESVVFISCGIH
jgi:hypothetical protein